MRIGLDLDNVISDFDKDILIEYLKEDKKKRNNGIINPEAKHISSGMFDWSKEENEEFFKKNMPRIAKKLEVKKNAKYYIDKLKEIGCEIIIITHRGESHYGKLGEKISKDWLKQNKIYYSKFIISSSPDKSEECKKANVDIMFDDSTSGCSKMRANGINVYLMATKYNVRYKKDLELVKDWKELFSKVTEFILDKKDKTNIILDTDTNNEVDDYFALAYLLKSLDKINLEAVTIAPYETDEDNIKEGIEKSYQVCEKIFKYLNIDYSNKIHKGSKEFHKNEYTEKTEAVEKIIKIAHKNQNTTIIAIGALTNIAIALKTDPTIKEKIKIIWLGGHSLSNLDNNEFNFKQDIEAVDYVFNSKIDLTVIPCKGVASNLTTTIYELKNYFNIDSGLGKLLYDRFTTNGTELRRRVIWDISAVAYAINPYWFDYIKISCPIINGIDKYEMTQNKHQIKFITNLNTNAIYKDFFKKVGDKDDTYK